MTSMISLRTVRVLIDGHDTDGRLVMADGQLAAVIVRLDGAHHEADGRGLWHLEAGFGRCAPPPCGAPLWATPEAAGLWIGERLAAAP